MKKGFTLIELLAVIILLGIIGLLIFPILTNTISNSKEKLYEAQLEEIRLAAEKWAYLNTGVLPTVENEEITITLQELKKSGLIGLDIRNPIDNELISNGLHIRIVYKGQKYYYYVDGQSGNQLDSEYNENAPTLILNGNVLEYVEYGSNYIDKGAVSKNKLGNNIGVTVMYQNNGEEVSGVDTSTFNTFTIIYTATSDGYTSTITRTVIVRDTTSPVLTIPDNVEVSIDTIETFDILDGVEVTDNSGEKITVTVDNYDKILGQNVVSYKACDSHNNCTIKKRIINIVQ